MNSRFSCIIPTLANDYHETRRHLYLLFDLLSIDKLIFIGPCELKEPVTEDAKIHDVSDRVEFINEQEILSFDEVKQAYYKRLAGIEAEFGKPERISRTGWYYQQFLKMEYHKICKDEYYLSWDADTIPLKHIDMFSSFGIPYFDIKPECIHPYFDTINNLLGFGKVIGPSFISEHMLFDKSLMSELYDDILSSPLDGDNFYEKIFSAIKHPFQGFSEFETYGSWIARKHPSKYRLRNWKSLRNASFFIKRSDLTEDDLKWLATGFDAASFERYQETDVELAGLFRDPHYRQKLSADIFYEELLKTGIFGEYQNGGIIKDNNLYPV